MKTLLFDIDGTLINTGGAGGAALLRAFRDQFAVEEPGSVAFSGRTDRAISRSLFELHGIPDVEDNWQRLQKSYLDLLPGCMEERQGRVLDGVEPLLNGLQAAGNSLLGLLTGNVREGARIKLEFFGLFDRFRFGGFGDEHYDRDHVAREAQTAATPHLGNGHGAQDCWVIGDTPLDISCARAINARVLAVATGIHPRAELSAAEPDILLDDLSNTDHLLSVLLA
jgi:phosphoglycolate phosphatase-like HAD superfamily hydrolase